MNSMKSTSDLDELKRLNHIIKNLKDKNENKKETKYQASTEFVNKVEQLKIIKEKINLLKKEKHASYFQQDLDHLEKQSYKIENIDTIEEKYETLKNRINNYQEMAKDFYGYQKQLNDLYKHIFEDPSATKIHKWILGLQSLPLSKESLYQIKIELPKLQNEIQNHKEKKIQSEVLKKELITILEDSFVKKHFQYEINTILETHDFLNNLKEIKIKIIKLNKKIAAKRMDESFRLRYNRIIFLKDKKVYIDDLENKYNKFKEKKEIVSINILDSDLDKREQFFNQKQEIFQKMSEMKKDIFSLRKQRGTLQKFYQLLNKNLEKCLHDVKDTSTEADAEKIIKIKNELEIINELCLLKKQAESIEIVFSKVIKNLLPNDTNKLTKNQVNMIINNAKKTIYDLKEIKDQYENLQMIYPEYIGKLNLSEQWYKLVNSPLDHQLSEKIIALIKKGKTIQKQIIRLQSELNSLLDLIKQKPINDPSTSKLYILQRKLNVAKEQVNIKKIEQLKKEIAEIHYLIQSAIRHTYPPENPFKRKYRGL